MSGLELGFTICAAVGGGIFIIRTVLQFVGGLDDADLGDIGDSDVDLSDSDASFRLLSLQGASAFLMMFGLAGRALLLDNKASAGMALLGAVVAGAICFLIISWIFRAGKRLQSSGNLDNRAAVGEQGTVYLTIPAGGVGKVQVKVAGHLKVLDAMSEDKEDLKTETEIKVVRVTGDNILVVTSQL